MKKLVKVLLIFLLAFAGGMTGAYSYERLITCKVTETNDSNVQSTVNNEQISYVVKENSDLKTAIKKAYDTVVEIKTEVPTQSFFYQQSTGYSLGSGVIVSADGYIITNNHVIEGAQKITVTTSDGKEYEAALIGTDEKTDLAVIKIEAGNLKYSELADSDRVEIGDDAIAIGNPLGEGISVSNGIISAKDKQVTISRETMYLLQTNAAVNEGNSGGGLFDINGDLIGIVNAKSKSSFYTSDVEGLGYAIPSNTVKRITGELIENGYVRNRATLGVKLSDVTQDTSNYKKGLYIVEVVADSAAEKAGLKENDRIIGFNGTEISSYAELSKLINECSVGDTASIKVVREEKELTLNVTLQEAIRE